MIVGIDFDNTLVGYDHLFAPAASAEGWLPAGFTGGKTDVRNALRDLPDGENKWQRIQAVAYGHRMAEARMVEGAGAFLAQAAARGVGLAIVSHKTRHPAADPLVDLHRAAWRWLEANDVFRHIARERVFFEPTRRDKVARIAALGCTHFIDDLVEVFEEPDYPAAARRMLLAPAGAAPGAWDVFTGWDEIAREILRDAG